MSSDRDYLIYKNLLSPLDLGDIYYADYLPSTMEYYATFMVNTTSFSVDGDFSYGYYDEKTAKYYKIIKSELFDPEHYNKLHNHNYFEMVFVLDGEIDVRIESGKYHYRKGEGYLLNRNTRHTEVLSGTWKTIGLWFRKECILNWPKAIINLADCNQMINQFFCKNLGEDGKNNKDYIDFHVRKGISTSSQAHAILTNLFEEFSTRKAGFQLVTYGLIARFFALISAPLTYESRYVDLGSDSERDVAKNAKRYIDDQKRRVTRKELADFLHYNGDYINRIFKKFTGDSLHTYCQKVYMTEAIQLLLETDLPTTDIARMLGFENRTQFYKNFKTFYSITPHEYRISASSDIKMSENNTE